MTEFLSDPVMVFGIQAFVTLFVIFDPPGTAPIFISLTADQPVKTQRKLAWQAAGVSLLVIVVFALFGNALLQYLNISLAAIQGAGGVLLFLTGMALLTGTDPTTADQTAVGNDNIALVPLGTPLLAGPGAIVTTMLYVQKADGLAQLGALGLAIVAVHIIIGLTFVFSTNILGLLRQSGVTLLARIAGLLLSAIAIEMVVSAIKAFFNL